MISVRHIIVLVKNDVEYFDIFPPGPSASAMRRREWNEHRFDGSLLILGVDFARGAVQEADQRKGVVVATNNDARGIAEEDGQCVRFDCHGMGFSSTDEVTDLSRCGVQIQVQCVG
jgi:hypothetical protein